jgi:D-alanyl-D-alanine carboxypeptidase
MATPTATPSPSPSKTVFPLPTLEATLGPCSARRPSDLFAEVSDSYGLSPAYVPPDLVRLGGYVSGTVALPDLMLRQEAAAALGRMAAAMKAEGLAPTVLSAYRSYVDQSIAYQRWLNEDPAEAEQISAPPGHSEHQLGTAVDFGSPGLAALTGDPAEKFSPLFAQTAEGAWLASHAYEYGFTLTNPPGAERLTGLTYEPWHYRYVGADLAAYLHESGYFLAEYLLLVRPGMPCLPD